MGSVRLIDRLGDLSQVNVLGDFPDDFDGAFALIGRELALQRQSALTEGGG